MTTKQTEGLSREEKMLRGTAWSTLSDFVSKLLGALYIIPWYTWMGEVAPQANALFGMGYTIYAYFLLISTVGLNTAVAKQIAKYNAIGQEAKSMSLIWSFIKLMLGIGLVSAIVLYAGAPFFAWVSGDAEGLVQVIRSLTLAVLVFPVMSVFRGIFQGYNNIKPSAISQMAEQFVRVIWMFLTAYWIMKLGSGDYIKAVSQSTFAAFIGMIASMAVLLYYFWKEGHLAKLLQHRSGGLSGAETRQLLKETVRVSIPILVTGSAIQVYQLIDQVTFINFLHIFTGQNKEELTILFSFLSANPSKIITIIVSVAASIGGIGIALLTESFMQEDRKGTARLILNNFQMLLVFILPTLMGAIILAKPLYAMFYTSTAQIGIAIGLFIGLLIQAFFQGLYSMVNPMLHAVFESRRAVLHFVYGLLLKLVLQVPFLYLFGAYGPVLSTALALWLPSWLMMRHLQEVTGFNPQVVYKNAAHILLMTLIMAVPVLLVAIGLKLHLPVQSRLSAVVHLLAGGSLGILVYGYLALRTRATDKLLGARAQVLRQKLRIK